MQILSSLNKCKLSKGVAFVFRSAFNNNKQMMNTACFSF